MKILKSIVNVINWTRSRHLIPFGIYLVIYLVWFRILEVIPRTHYWIIALPIDRVLPFVEQFIIPYLSWFFYILVGTLTVYYLDQGEYDKLATKLIFGMTAFLLISTFFPNRQPFRLLEMPRENVFTKMVALLWKVDSPTNVWPSIHVFNSVVVEAALLRADNVHLKRKPIRVLSLLWCILICLSTVMIKQHSTLDIITALALVLFAYLLVEVYGRVLVFPRWDRWAEQLERRVLGAQFREYPKKNGRL